MNKTQLFDFVHGLGKEDLFFDQVPEPLREDFENFIVGKTIGKEGGRLYAYPVDARAYKNKLINMGFDYDVQLTQ